MPPNFTHALIICLGRFLSPFQSAEPAFESPHGEITLLWQQPGAAKLQKCCEPQLLFDALPPAVHPFKALFREAQKCSLGRVGGKTKKIWPSKLLVLKLRIFPFDEREAFAYSRNNNFSSTQLHDVYGVGKLSIS